MRKIPSNEQTYIVSGIGVIVDTAEESSRRIPSDILREQMTATRVLIHERRNVMNKASNDNQRPLLRLLQD